MPSIDYTVWWWGLRSLRPYRNQLDAYAPAPAAVEALVYEYMWDKKCLFVLHSVTTREAMDLLYIHLVI